MSKHDATIAELADALADATTEASAALRAHGEHSREYRNAEAVRIARERALGAAQHRADEKARRNALTPAQINDELDGRWR